MRRNRRVDRGRDPMPLDVLALGRCGVDVYPLQSGIGLEAVQTFGKFLGGSPTNVAVGAARLGRRAAVVSGVGDDAFGRFVRSEMARLGVDTSRVEVVAGALTPVAFCALFPPDDFPLTMYRSQRSPDLRIRPESLDEDDVRQAGVVWMTGTGLSAAPSLDTHRRALELRRGAGHAVIDLDYRAKLWANPAAAPALLREAIAATTVAVGNREECLVAVGESNPDRAADALLEAGAELAIVKQGPGGVLARTREETVTVPPVTVRTVNGLGAGDAFGGALCHGLLAGWSLRRTIEFANAAGAIVASRLECAAAMPTAIEVERVLSSRIR